MHNTYLLLPALPRASRRRADCEERESFFHAEDLISRAIARHSVDTKLARNGKCEVADANFKHVHEHKHECGRAHWPAILLADVVLTGRVMEKFKKKKKFPEDICKSMKTLVGQLNFHERQEFLKEHYSFKCQYAQRLFRAQSFGHCNKCFPLSRA